MEDIRDYFSYSVAFLLKTTLFFKKVILVRNFLRVFLLYTILFAIFAFPVPCEKRTKKSFGCNVLLYSRLQNTSKKDEKKLPKDLVDVIKHTTFASAIEKQRLLKRKEFFE